MSGARTAIRAAAAGDAAAVAACVQAAYAVYLERMDTPPGPMLADYARVIAEHETWGMFDDAGCLAALVLIARPDHLLLDNIAVHPRAQGRGLARALLAHTEVRARALGFAELRLYTHIAMTENVAMYTHLGWQKTSEGHQDGYHRVFMRKPVPPASG